MPRIAAPVSSSGLAIAKYDDLTVGEIKARLTGLTQTDLAKVYKYERSQNPSTVLGTIVGKLVELPSGWTRSCPDTAAIQKGRRHPHRSPFACGRRALRLAGSAGRRSFPGPRGRTYASGSGTADTVYLPAHKPRGTRRSGPIRR